MSERRGGPSGLARIRVLGVIPSSGVGSRVGVGAVAPDGADCLFDVGDGFVRGQCDDVLGLHDHRPGAVPARGLLGFGHLDSLCAALGPVGGTAALAAFAYGSGMGDGGVDSDGEERVGGEQDTPAEDPGAGAAENPGGALPASRLVDQPPALMDDDSPGEVAEAFAADPMEDAEAWGFPSAARVPRLGATRVPRAGVFRRVAAAALDALLSLLVAAFALLVSELLWLRSAGDISVPVWVPLLVYFVAGWAHTLAGEGVFGGATLGKRALGLRVVGGGGLDPALWRVALRRMCLDAVVLLVAVLALWFTMVRQYRGLPGETPVEFDLADALVFCAFVVNLLVLLALGRRFDPQRRFPHDSLAGLAVISAAQPAVGSFGRRVAAPVGAVRPRWTPETTEVVPPRPWDGRRWRRDGVTPGVPDRGRPGPLSRVIDSLVGWGQPNVSEKPLEPAAKDSADRLADRPLGLVHRLADRLVSWSEGERGASSASRDKDPAG